MTELEFYNRITLAGLTPNQYFAAMFHLLDVQQKVLYNPTVELRGLKRGGFITEKGIPTEKLIETGLFEEINKLIVADDNDEKSLNRKIAYYIQLFPALRLPSGAFARASVNEVKPIFLEFFNHYTYDWETIYDATRNYINYYKNNDYKFMRNCKYFIMKNGGESQLSLECEAIKTNTEISKDPFTFDI